MGGDDSQKLLPWRGIFLLSGAQTFRFSGVSLYLKTRPSVLSQPDLFSGVGCMASPIAAIDDWHRWSPWHHQTGTLLHRH
jgi:hypothetical protein